LRSFPAALIINLKLLTQSQLKPADFSKVYVVVFVRRLFWFLMEEEMKQEQLPLPPSAPLISMKNHQSS
jgi:hypothetical protein